MTSYYFGSLKRTKKNNPQEPMYIGGLFNSHTYKPLDVRVTYFYYGDGRCTNVPYYYGKDIAKLLGITSIESLMNEYVTLNGSRDLPDILVNTEEILLTRFEVEWLCNNKKLNPQYKDIIDWVTGSLFECSEWDAMMGDWGSPAEDDNYRSPVLCNSNEVKPSPEKTKNLPPETNKLVTELVTDLVNKHLDSTLQAIENKYDSLIDTIIKYKKDIAEENKNNCTFEEMHKEQFKEELINLIKHL